MVKKMATKRRRRKQKKLTTITDAQTHFEAVNSASNKRPLPKKNQHEIVVLKTSYDDLRKRVAFLENEIIYMKCQEIISAKMEEQLAMLTASVTCRDGLPIMLEKGKNKRNHHSLVRNQRDLKILDLIKQFVMNKYELKLIEPTVAIPKVSLPEITASPSRSVKPKTTKENTASNTQTITDNDSENKKEVTLNCLPEIPANSPPPLIVEPQEELLEGTHERERYTKANENFNNKENIRIVRFHSTWKDNRIYEKRKNDSGNMKLPSIK